MSVYKTNGDAIEKYAHATNEKAKKATWETMMGSSPFHAGQGPGRGEDKKTRRVAGDSPEHK